MLNELKAKGVQIKFWDKPMLDLFHEKWLEVAKEQSEKSPDFKKAWDPSRRSARTTRSGRITAT